LTPSPGVDAAMVVAHGAGLHCDAWLTREVAVAGFLARAGAPVVAPSALVDPGPHHHGGRTLTYGPRRSPR
jgi:hypothetical protein